MYLVDFIDTLALTDNTATCSYKSKCMILVDYLEKKLKIECLVPDKT